MVTWFEPRFPPALILFDVPMYKAARHLPSESSSPRCRPCRLITILLLGLCLIAFADQAEFLSERLLQSVLKRYGQPAMERMLAWQELLRGASPEPESEKLVRVNRFFNQIPNVPDIDNYGEPDYWATPLELLANNAGDCEDFAIAKYFSLTRLGVPPERLRLTYVRCYEKGERLTITPHLVLTYYPDASDTPLVLDNLIPEIMPANERKDLVPTYSFNADGLWKARERARGQRLSSADRIYKWKDLLERMEAKGTRTGRIR